MIPNAASFQKFDKRASTVGSVVCVLVTVMLLAAAAIAQPTAPKRAELVVQTGHVKGVYSLAFSRNGRTLATGSDGTIKLWDTESGKELRTLDHELMIDSMAFSPDGQLLATSTTQTLKVWNIASGRELYALEGTFRSLAFSPDGRMLLAAGDNTVLSWDARSGKKLRAIKNPNSNVNAVAFAPDGRTMAGASSDKTITVWDVSGAGAPLILAGHTATISSIVISPDGKLLASGDYDHTIRVWDLASGRELYRLATQIFILDTLAFSPDSRTLAAGSALKVQLWDVATAEEVRALSGHTEGITELAFSREQQLLASASHDGIVKLWDTRSWRELRTLKGHTSYVFSHALSSNSRMLAVGAADGTVRLWDIANGQGLSALRGHTSHVWSVAFSPNNRILASASFDHTIKLWDVTSRQELRTLKGHTDRASSVVFSPDGRTLASGSSDRTIKVWEVSTGRELRTIRGHPHDVNFLAYSPDGRTLVAGSGSEMILSGDETITLWDVESGTARGNRADKPETRARLGFFTGEAKSARFIAETIENGKIKLSDRNTGKELCSLIAVDENDWLVVAPDGFFDGSPKAWKQVIWRLDNNTFRYVPVEAFFGDYFRPGLLQDIFNGNFVAADIDISRKDIRQPGVTVAFVDDKLKAESIVTREVDITVEVLEAPPDDSRPNTSSGAKDVRLFRNGSLVKLWPGDAFNQTSGCQSLPTASGGPRRALCQTRVRLIAGENQLTAYAFNNDNVKSSDDTLTLNRQDTQPRKGVAYVLAVGIDKYVNTHYNLKYAVADARDFAEEFKRQQASLNNFERVEPVPLNDEDATKANIIKALADLSAKIQPEDILVIFFAGHGTAQQNRFYLIPHDLGYMGSRTRLSAAGLQSILTHSISDVEIERAVEGIDAGQMLLVIDACNSGQALEAEEKRRGPMNSKGLAQLAYEKGMYILTAAQSYQAAWEAARLGHGFLTSALVEEGLKSNAADLRPKDGQVLLREWLDYATERVPQMHQEELEAQRKQRRQLVRTKVAESNTGAERSVQRPRVFYRREMEPQPLVVARP